MNKTIGLALSGGGVRGAAHIGLLKYLKEIKIEPSVIAGTSAGAIVGGFYAAGHDVDTMLTFFKENRLFDFSHFSWMKPGLLDTEGFMEDLKPYFPEDKIENLDKKLFITATEILQGTLKIFEKGSIVKAILASAAFPGIFSPIKIDHDLYVDGGTFNNFPSDIIRDKCDFLIGLNANPINEVSEDQMDGTLNILRRVYELSVRRQGAVNEKYCDVVITPGELVNYNEFNQNNVDEIFEIGYEEARIKLHDVEI